MNRKYLAGPALSGAFWMVSAGAVFALLNVMIQVLTGALALPPAATAFWQYGFALLFSLPFILKTGFSALGSRYRLLHVIRVVLAALGVQAWVIGLATVPIWQAIALAMTSPFFIVLGARLFLRERVTVTRWLTTATAFAGALVILEPWTENFSAAALLPVLSALLWGASSLMTKSLTGKESPEAITLWLLVLLTPINGLLAMGSFALPHGEALMLCIAAGLLTALAQYLLTRAYAAADAAYVQPFDDLKLPLNILAGWLAFGYAPSGSLWLGALLILGASLFVMLSEMRSRVRGEPATA